MENVIFYSTHCPRCKVIERKLQLKNIKYTEVNDVEEMRSIGLQSAPALKVGDSFFDFSAANKWINEQGVQDEHKY